MVIFELCKFSARAEDEAGVFPDQLSQLMMKLVDYTLETSSAAGKLPLEQMLDTGDTYDMIVSLSSLTEFKGSHPLSLQGFGHLRARIELALLQLTLSSQNRILLAANQSIKQGRDEWLHALADDMRNAASVFVSDRHTVAMGYIALYWVMTSSLSPDNDGMVRMESYSSMTQAWWLGQQAAAALVGKICEVGFNAGHSALAMLSSAPEATTLVSFDTCSKSYTLPCAEFLQMVFPDRFTLVKGLSNETISQYARRNLASPRCDLIFIDGGHTEEEATADLLLMSLLADARSLVVMEDVGCHEEYCAGPTAAWDAFQRAGRLRELGCAEDGTRRWCWGLYL